MRFNAGIKCEKHWMRKKNLTEEGITLVYVTFWNVDPELFLCQDRKTDSMAWVVDSFSRTQLWSWFSAKNFKWLFRQMLGSGCDLNALNNHATKQTDLRLHSFRTLATQIAAPTPMASPLVWCFILAGHPPHHVIFEPGECVWISQTMFAPWLENVSSICDQWGCTRDTASLPSVSSSVLAQKAYSMCLFWFQVLPPCPFESDDEKATSKRSQCSENNTSCSDNP